MGIRELTTEEKLGDEYCKHIVFHQLDGYIKFYESLSFSVMSWITGGTLALINIDTYTYSSIQGTIESIKIVLQKGRVNDAYALLRKFYDVTMINIYNNLYLKNNYGLENIVVGEINNWIKGTATIPEYRVLSRYIKNDECLSHITKLLNKDDRYKEIRSRCNDHTHYNFYRNLLANDNEVHDLNRIKDLGIFLNDLDNIFVQHFAYMFTINQHYMSSSDYRDYIELGLTPEEDSKYWVASFIQKLFDSVLKKKRPDIAIVMKEKTSMKLE